MRKILTALVLFVFAVLPMSVMAMQAISDNELSTTTGQAGVSINLDTNINLTVGTLAWGDKDGLGAASTEATGAGWVGVTSLNTNVRIRLREDLIRTALGGATAGETFVAANQTVINTYASAAATLIAGYNQVYNKNLPANSGAMIATSLANITRNLTPAQIGALPGYPAFDTAKTNLTNAITGSANPTAVAAFINASNAISPLTIDVATDSGIGHGSAGTSFVRIGLGSIGIYMGSLSTTVALGSSTTLDQVLGSVYISGMNILINAGSYVDIYNGRGTDTQGVTLGLDVTIDSIAVATLAWGDADGIHTTNYAPFYDLPANGGTTTASDSLINHNAGYVGLKGTTIAGLGIYGPVTIDVATDDGTTAGYKQSGINTTFVRIGLAGLNIRMGSLETTAVIGNSQNLVASNGADGIAGTADDEKFDTFGSIYLSGLNLTFGTGSRLDIYNYYGQSGVVLDFALNLGTVAITTLSWGDADGIGPLTSRTTAGYVGLNNLTITNLAIGGIVTINVATAKGTDSLVATYGSGKTFVRMGFNAVSVGMDTMDATVALGNNKGLSNNGLGSPANAAQELGSIYVGGLTAVVNGSVDIMSAPTIAGNAHQGVVFMLNNVTVAIPTAVTALSWGDVDGTGIAGSNAAGYVGLKDLTIGTISANGKVTIDVASVAFDTTGLVNSTITLMYKAYLTHLMSPSSGSFVHIGLGTGNAVDTPTAVNALSIGINGLAADLALDNNATAGVFGKTLGNAGLGVGQSGLLGSIYIGNMTARINGWVDIAAH